MLSDERKILSMAKVFETYENKLLILLNEEELEVQKLYFCTDKHDIGFYPEIPEVSDSYFEFQPQDYYSNECYLYKSKFDQNEPFMVLEKCRKKSKYSCIKIIQNDMICWIVERCPNKYRSDHVGYISAMDWPDIESMRRFIVGVVTTKKLEEPIVDGIAFLKKCIKEKIEIENKKKENSPIFEKLKAKYSKKEF